MDKKEKELKIKCVNCGASLSVDEKVCSYCGSLNPNFKKKEVKELKPPKNQNVGMGSLFGGLFGNSLGKAFLDIDVDFDED